MPDDGEPGFFSVRPKMLILIGAVTGSLLIVALVVAWLGLPRWAPAFVVAGSPWIGPAFEAAVHGKLKSEFRGRLPEWGDRVVPAMCSFLGSRDPKRRMFAAEVLQGLKDPRGIQALTDALGDPDPEVLDVVITTLASSGDPRASGPLLTALPRLDHGWHAWRAAERIGDLAHPDLFAQVTSTLLATSQPKPVQVLGYLVLHGSTDPRALALLDDRLGKEEYRAAIRGTLDPVGWALGESRHPGALAAIVRAMADADPDRRFGAASAAWRRKDAALLEPLLRLITDPELRVRQAAINALSAYPQDEAITALGRVIADGGEAGRLAASSLARIGSPAAIATLVAQLANPDAETRVRLLRELGYRASKLAPADIEAVLRLLADPDPRVVQAVKGMAYQMPLSAEQRERVRVAGQ